MLDAECPTAIDAGLEHDAGQQVLDRRRHDLDDDAGVDLAVPQRAAHDDGAAQKLHIAERQNRSIDADDAAHEARCEGRMLNHQTVFARRHVRERESTVLARAACCAATERRQQGLQRTLELAAEHGGWQQLDDCIDDGAAPLVNRAPDDDAAELQHDGDRGGGPRFHGERLRRGRCVAWRGYFDEPGPRLEIAQHERPVLEALRRRRRRALSTEGIARRRLRAR